MHLLHTTSLLVQLIALYWVRLMASLPTVLFCRSPAVDAEPASPTTATVLITPPPNGPWTRYDLTVCPVAGPASECVNTTCTTPSSCPVTGLDPGTTYVTTVGWRVVLDD